MTPFVPTFASGMGNRDLVTLIQNCLDQVTYRLDHLHNAASDGPIAVSGILSGTRRGAASGEHETHDDCCETLGNARHRPSYCRALRGLACVVWRAPSTS